MALSVDRRERILRRINTLESQRDAIEDALINRLSEGKGYVAGYSLDTGHGKQQVSYTRVTDMNQELSIIEAELDRLYRILHGLGVKTITMRRKS